MYCSRFTRAVVVSGVLTLVGLPALAHEGDQAGSARHRMITAKITKIDGTMLFVQPKAGLMPRAISMRKAERMGLHDAKVGEEVMLVVDESDVLVDVHRMGVPPQGHRLLAGKLQHLDPFSGVIKIQTSEGTETFPVDSLAGSKLSVLHDASSVQLELDEDNTVIDIHPTH